MERVWGPFHLRRLTVALLSMVCVLSLTHIPQAALPRALQHSFFDKFEHLAAYGAVALFFILSLRKPVHLLPLLGVLLALALIGAVDEMTQPLVNRQASMVDYMADLIGISAVGVMALVKRHRAPGVSSMGGAWRPAAAGSWRHRRAGRPGSANRATGRNRFV
jgi:VanZ family protein